MTPADEADWEEAGVRLTEAICAARRDQIDARIASFFADPRWPELRPHVARLLGADLAPLDSLLRRIRRDLWRDFSEPAE